MTPKEIAELDPGIRRTVAWLNANGFETTDSGDGVSKPDMECALDYPNVFMVVPPEAMVQEAARLYELLKTQGVPFGPDSLALVEVTYSPVDGVAVLSLIGVDDTILGIPV